MPLLTFDLIEGRTEQEVKTLLDAAHRAVLRAFEVPERDRYQIVHENKAHHMVIEDTGLGLTRTRDLVVVRVYTSPRSEAQKQRFFAILQEELAEHCGLSGDDLMVSIISKPERRLELWPRGRAVSYRRSVTRSPQYALSGGLPSRYAAAPAARYSPATPGHRLPSMSRNWPSSSAA
ncbi:4-oxalocrotonate tautomerase [Klebsiella pneumoniae]|uniref:4-oxalocrotonate tautomerase n=7 Tax=Gammaproteobacteria TaxID=1236 RepID=A0A3S4GB48_KLEPN|nr:4-oxalocrotonate tautomerase [Klebsiella pneumoniae]